MKSLIAHLSIGTNCIEQSAHFYKELLSILCCKVFFEYEEAIAFGREEPEVWLVQPLDLQKAEAANGTHFAFRANCKKEVDEFHSKGLELGANNAGDPGPRPAYGEHYYGCFLIDLDGHKIEACYLGD